MITILIILLVVFVVISILLFSKVREIKPLKKSAEILQGEVTSLKVECATLTTKLKAEKDSEERIKTTFENIAHQVLEQKSEKFSKDNSNQLKNILEPLEKDISDFKKRIEESNIKQAQEKTSLSGELKQLMLLNQQLSTEANNLTKALKGEKNNKMQGDWGEMILETILSNSGLESGVHYFTQETSKNDVGETIRPDVIVRYPDSSEVIIDSKVSLTAYSRFVSAESDEQRAAALSDHIESIKRHITQLSDKRYESRERSLDFVMMFMPIEPAYILALGNDNTLWQYAYSRKILLVSPTHLITALKLVYDLWTRDAQTKNTIAIAEQGAKMYDKFVSFVEDLQKVGASIEKSNSVYNDALSKLRDGKGNLIRQSEQLLTLGVKAKKQLMLTEKKDNE
ncbi:MAG: DNA recombination protein RmuC [Rikenellaceae bacterium]